MLLVLSTIASVIFIGSIFKAPHQIPVSLSGHSTLNVLAERATISLYVSSEGSKQSRVAQEVHQTTDEILNLLRPLTLPPNRTTHASDTPTLPSDFLPPLATLSVNTFSSNSYPRPGLLGEGTTYTSSITITAEFRSLHPFSSESHTNQSRTVIPASGFHHLSLVLPSLAKLPHTKVDFLKWHLTPEHLASLQSQARQNAMSEALRKAADYTSPMSLRFPAVRCVKFSEGQRRRPHEHTFRMDRDLAYNRKLQRDSGVMFQRSADYDELEEGEYGYEIEEHRNEAFGLEPKGIEVVSDVSGEFVVVERGMVRAVVGFFL